MFFQSKSSILKRCEDDRLTRERLRYDPFYHAVEKQDGAYVWVRGKRLIMMSSNDYLGLSDHPRVLEAAERALRTWGSSTTGARMCNGTRVLHEELEERLAAHVGKEACQVHEAGYLSCMAAVSTFAEKGDLILADRNIHSSLWAGIGLSGARIERFSHNKPESLAEVLEYEDPETPKMLVVEGVYSMEGHIAPLRELLDVCRGHNVFTVLDDAHGLGVTGEQGRGTAVHTGTEREVDVIAGSLSKSLSSVGGYVAGSREVIEYLRTHSKQTIFSAASSPAQTASALEVLNILVEEPEHRERLLENTRYYKSLLRQIGVDYWDSETPAVPLIMGDRVKAYRVWQTLFENGIFTVMALAPAVPPGRDLIRTAVSARHTRADLERVVEVLAVALKKISPRLRSAG